VHHEKKLWVSPRVAAFERARDEILAAIKILDAEEGNGDAVVALRSVVRDLEAEIHKAAELSQAPFSGDCVF
jgi:hypothetical protein